MGSCGLPSRSVTAQRRAISTELATHPIQFLREEDFRAHEARVCIAEGEVLADPKRVRRFQPTQYFRTRAEMMALFADLPAALANSVEIARRCAVTLRLGNPQLPIYPTPEGVSIEEYLRLKVIASFLPPLPENARLHPH